MLMILHSLIFLVDMTLNIVLALDSGKVIVGLLIMMGKVLTP